MATAHPLDTDPDKINSDEILALPFPPEIFHQILDILQKSNKHRTLATLRSCSSWIYNTVTPYLFEHVICNSSQLCDFLSPLNISRWIHSPASRLPVIPSRTHPEKFEPSFEARIRNEYHHVKKFTLLRDVEEVLGPQEVENRLIEAIPQGVDLVFPNLQSFSLDLAAKGPIMGGPDLSSELSTLGQICRPSKMCLTNSDPYTYTNNDWPAKWELPESLIYHKLGCYFHQPPIRLEKDSSGNVVPRCFRTSLLKDFNELDCSLSFDDGEGGGECSTESQIELLFQVAGFCLENKDVNDATTWKIISSQSEDTYSDRHLKHLKNHLDEILSRYNGNDYMEILLDDQFYCHLQLEDPEECGKQMKEWFNKLEWVFGADAINEPPCEACGMPV